MTLADLNQCDRETFVSRLRFLFEGQDWVPRAAWAARPFASVDDLDRALGAAIATGSPERHLALIRAYPDLAGRLAIAGHLGQESTREHAAAGLDRLSPDQYAIFARLNAAYRARHGFPFVICSRDNTTASILAAFTARLEQDRETEIATALAEIVKITRLRLRDALGDDGAGPHPAAG